MMADRTVKILLVDSNIDARKAFAQYFFHYPDFKIYEAENCEDGIHLTVEVKPDLIISEYRMPVLDGIEFCRRIRQNPEVASTIFLLYTAEGDERLKVKGFESGIDDYIAKPASPMILTSKIKAFLRIGHLQNKLVVEKERIVEANALLEQNFKELTDILLKIIDLRVPGAADRASTAKKITGFVCEKMKLDEDKARKIIFGSQLHEIGKIGLPDTIADKNKGSMVMEDRTVYNQHPVIGSLIISTISGYKEASDTIYHQYENYDGSGTPGGLMGDEIPVGARILRGVVLQGDLHRSGYHRKEIIQEIRRAANHVLDPFVSASITEFIIEKDEEFDEGKHKIGLEELEAGMIVAEDVYAASGIKLIPAGVIIKDHMIRLLTNRNKSDPIIGGVYVITGRSME